MVFTTRHLLRGFIIVGFALTCLALGYGLPAMGVLYLTLSTLVAAIGYISVRQSTIKARLHMAIERVAGELEEVGNLSAARKLRSDPLLHPVVAGRLSLQLEVTREQLTQIERMWEINGETVTLEQRVGKVRVGSKWKKGKEKRLRPSPTTGCIRRGVEGQRPGL